MKKDWISLCGLLAVVSAVQPNYRSYSIFRCECNGRSKYCLPDAFGLHCLDCQGNTEGRHCERCKHGFFLQGAAQSCTPCHCNSKGSVSATCDSRGRCSCKEGVTGQKCDSCPNGPIGPNGCTQSRQLRQDSSSETSPCFCYGHSSNCSPQSSYSVHNISSTFSNGPEDWKVATVQGVTPAETYFRWSPKYQDVEVISGSILPVFLYAPDAYLGNQLLSYGQNLSFWMRMDRGVRHPSINDVILEGAGLRVGASLGDLRFVIPCGKKIKYSFRLDEHPASGWRPQLSPAQFKMLLHNLTAIKIRATFGENGRGYLDNVQLVSARPGSGVPAHWVQTCSCPRGYEGDFCERCSVGFRRSIPADGAFSPCELCSCQGGSCNPHTGDCFSADETPGDRSCSKGFYRSPWQLDTCVKCPCPDGVSCSLAAGSIEPRCNQCPPGTTGPRCDVCEEGFYGDPEGLAGVQQSCRPCRCNGHIDPNVAGSCDRRSGECLKCLNNTKGLNCETCVGGFYHSQPADACKACNCDAQHSVSQQCDDSGQCKCRPGFEGQRCHRSSCPACFSPLKAKMDVYTDKVKDLETLVLNMDGGLKPADKAKMEAALRDADDLVNDLQEDSNFLAEMEKKLQGRLSSISKDQLAEEQNLQDINDKADDIKQQQQTHKTEVKEVQSLLNKMKQKLEEAKNNLKSIEIPLGAAPMGSNFLSSLLNTATDLANKHKATADEVEQTASSALSDSEKSLSLMKDIVKRENKVKELIGDLKSKYDQTSARVKDMESQAKRLSDNAKKESKIANGMLKDVASLGSNIPSDINAAMDAMVSKMNGVKKAVDENTLGLEALQDGVQQNTIDAENLLAQGKAAQEDVNKLIDRVSVAKDVTEDALRGIDFNTGALDGVLNSLRGFDQQIDSNKARADAAIDRLPAISNTIQQAVQDNGKTLSLLDDVSLDFNNALGGINVLGNLVDDIEGLFQTIPSHAGLEEHATTLNLDANNLKTMANDAAGALASDLDQTRRMQDDAEKAAAGAATAFNNAKQAKDSVGKILSDIENMLANIDKPGAIDETQLKQIEESVAKAQKDVADNLRPRLTDMLDKEAAQRRRLAGINTDIDAILADIANLEEIVASIPTGCYNSPPIEEA